MSEFSNTIFYKNIDLSYGACMFCIWKSASVGTAGAEKTVNNRKSSREAAMSDSVKKTDFLGAR